MLGNGVCDEVCGVLECGFDSGDCFFEDLDDVVCQNETCVELQNDCLLVSEGLCDINRIGDGFCDESCNIDVCLNDLGDCDRGFGFYSIRVSLSLLGSLALIAFIVILGIVVCGYDNEIHSGREPTRQEQYLETPNATEPGENSGRTPGFVEASNRKLIRQVSDSLGWKEGTPVPISKNSGFTAGSKPKLDDENSKWDLLKVPSRDMTTAQKKRTKKDTTVVEMTTEKDI